MGGYGASPPVDGYGPPAADGYPRPPRGGYDRSSTNGYGQPPATGSPPANGYDRTATNGYGQPPANGYGPPANGYDRTATNGYGQPPANGYGPPPANGRPSAAGYDRAATDGYGQPPVDGHVRPPGDGRARTAPTGYGRPYPPTGHPSDGAPDERRSGWIARGDAAGPATPHETGRWSASRGRWVPTEPAPENAPDFAIGRFEETGDVRQSRSRGRPRVVDGVDWSERLDRRPEWHPHTWDDAPTSRSTDWSEVPLPPPRPREDQRPPGDRRAPDDRRPGTGASGSASRPWAATTPTERDPNADRLVGEAVPAGTVSAIFAPLCWFAGAVVTYLIAAVLFNDGPDRAAAIRLAIDLLPWLGLASTMSVGIALVLRWLGAGWRAAGLGFAAAVVSGTLAMILNSLLGG